MSPTRRLREFSRESNLSNETTYKPRPQKINRRKYHPSCCVFHVGLPPTVGAVAVGGKKAFRHRLRHHDDGDPREALTDPRCARRIRVDDDCSL